MITTTTIKNPSFKMTIMQATYKALMFWRKTGKSKAFKINNRKGLPVLEVLIDTKGRAHVLCLRSKRFVTETVSAGLVL